MAAKAPSNALASRTSRSCVCNPNPWAASCASRTMRVWAGLADVHRSATRESPGIASVSTWTVLPCTPIGALATPVMLPPGRAWLAARPCATGSAAAPMTMGIVLVACWAAQAAVDDHVTRISTGYKITGQCASLTKQRREVLGHGKELESLSQSLGEPHVELLPSPKNRSNHAILISLSRACENQYGPHLAPQQTPGVMENVEPPDMREAPLTRGRQ